MAVSSRFRIAALALAGALVLALAIVALARDSADAAYKPPKVDQTEMVLRLNDLPRGFVVGDDSGCGSPETEGVDERIDKWAATYQVVGCSFQYERLFEDAGPEVVPPLVESGVFYAGGDPGATAGIQIAARVTKVRTGHHTPPQEISAPAIGDEARLFHSGDIGVLGHSRGKGSILYWRDGPFLAALLVAGGSPLANDRVVTRLAALQQKHIESPTPYTEDERNDSQVPLEDPRLKLPVYWLDASFSPGGGLPPSALVSSYVPAGKGAAPPGEKIELQYELGPRLGTWTRAGWRRYVQMKIGKVNWTTSCSKPTRTELLGGSAVIFGTHVSRRRNPLEEGPPPSPCPSKAPNHYFAVMYLGKVVVGINIALCYTCAEPHSGPYDSLRGMKEIVRALRLRPKPVY